MANQMQWRSKCNGEANAMVKQMQWRSKCNGEANAMASDVSEAKTVL